MTELDRILAASDAPPPSPGFAVAAMAAVRAEASRVPPMAFPWGLAAATLVGLPFLTWLAGRLLPPLAVGADPGLAWLAVALILSALTWTAAQHVLET